MRRALCVVSACTPPRSRHTRSLAGAASLSSALVARTRRDAPGWGGPRRDSAVACSAVALALE
eukprot:9386696-Heterocapsa_arctica.AAC.1